MFFKDEEFLACSRFFGECCYENLGFFFPELVIDFKDLYYLLDECFYSKCYLSISLVTIDYCKFDLLKLYYVDLHSTFVFNEDLDIDMSIVSIFLSYGTIISF